MYYVDSVLSIGKNHKICEDYIVINHQEIPFIIVSDGCSDSANTDIGSRIIAINAKNFITKNYSNIIVNKNSLINVFKQSLIHIKNLLLSESTLDATLLFAFIYEEQIHYFIIGDGIIAYKTKNATTIKTYHYQEEKVFYGNYYNNPSRLKAYTDAKVSLSLETTIINNENIVCVNNEEIFEKIIYHCIDLHSLEYFFLSTDGLLSCSVDPKVAKQHLIDFISFKNLKGEFIQRRYSMWKKNILKVGVNHQDDIGIAGFSFFELEKSL